MRLCDNLSGGVQLVTALGGTRWRGQRIGDNTSQTSKFFSGGAHPGGGLAVIGQDRWSHKMSRGGQGDDACIFRQNSSAADLDPVHAHIVLSYKGNNRQKPQLSKIVSQGRKDNEGKRTKGENTDICHRSDGIALHRDSRCLNSNDANSECAVVQKRDSRCCAKTCTYHHLDHLCIF